MKNQIKAISAVTLVTADMARAVAFYESLGLERHRGGPTASFSTFLIGTQHINVRHVDSQKPGLTDNCLIILSVDNVDKVYDHVTKLGYRPEFSPRDADWGERYFHLLDPDGHQLSFAQQQEVDPLPTPQEEHPG